MNNIITLARNTSVTYQLLSRILQYLSIRAIQRMVHIGRWFVFVFVCCILFCV